MFSGKRLGLARRRRGLSKKALAETLGIHPRTALRWEDGDRLPTEAEAARIAEALRFPFGFFFGPDVDEPTTGAASFRALSAMPARDRDAALAAGAFGFLLGDWVEQRFNLPVADLPDLSLETPEGAARVLRERWGIGERPINNMVHLLEAKGVRVFSMVENTRTVDAFSTWRTEKSYVFLNSQKTAERQRFDAAHELAHLVLHKHGGPHGREAEDEAQQFASAFLMPRSDVLAILPVVRDLPQMVAAKKRWRVAVAALNHRLHRLGLTSEWQYRTFAIQIQERGYRTAEPNGISRETSAVWGKVFDALRAEGTTKMRIASDLCLPVSEVENLVFGLANMLESRWGPNTVLRAEPAFVLSLSQGAVSALSGQDQPMISSSGMQTRTCFWPYAATIRDVCYIADAPTIVTKPTKPSPLSVAHTLLSVLSQMSGVFALVLNTHQPC